MPFQHSLNFGNIHHSHLVVGAIGASLGIAICAIYNFKSGKKLVQQSNVYETSRLLSEYLCFHYALPHEILRYDFGPKDAIDFPKRCAEVCLKYFKKEPGIPSKALDIGCAVGRSSFELCREFEFVMGIDLSHSFIKAANHLKSHGSLEYEISEEGTIFSQAIARVDPVIDRSRVLFQEGDACSLPADIGQFGCVLAANLICRLQDPRSFLEKLPNLVTPGGILVLVSPYNWMDTFTPKENWIGGFIDSDQKSNFSFQEIKKLLEPYFDLLEDFNMQFLIRESCRKNQWSVSHANVWKKKMIL